MSMVMIWDDADDDSYDDDCDDWCQICNPNNKDDDLTYENLDQDN